jgi:CheY-like chemotaxis protein
MREALTWTLGAGGAEVVGVGSAAAAMQSLSGHPPDVLVSDIGLPGEDGYALIRRVRQAAARRGERPVPSLALTAYARPEDRDQALEAGFDAYASKPVDAADLVRAVASLVGRVG